MGNKTYKVEVPILLPLVFEVEVESPDAEYAEELAQEIVTEAGNNGVFYDYDGNQVEVNDRDKLLFYSDVKTEPDWYVKSVENVYSEDIFNTLLI